MTSSPSTPRFDPRVYSPRSWRRAERAARCSPFRLKVFQTLRSQSVSLQDLTNDRGIHQGYTRVPLGELAAENELMWLIAVGLLRREVDGQGLTDSFRLTPLGRQLLLYWEDLGITELTPRVSDYLYNSLSRWLRLPGWLQA